MEQTLESAIVQADKVLTDNPYFARIRALSDYQTKLALLYVSGAARHVIAGEGLDALLDRALIFAEGVKD